MGDCSSFILNDLLFVSFKILIISQVEFPIWKVKAMHFELQFKEWVVRLQKWLHICNLSLPLPALLPPFSSFVTFFLQITIALNFWYLSHYIMPEQGDLNQLMELYYSICSGKSLSCHINVVDDSIGIFCHVLLTKRK